MLMNEYLVSENVPGMDGLDIYMKIEGLNAGNNSNNSLRYEMGLLGDTVKEGANRVAGIKSLLAAMLIR